MRAPEPPARLVAVLLALTLAGCATSAGAYRDAARARTLADVNALLVGTPATIRFADGTRVSGARDVRLDSDRIRWRTTLRPHHRPLADVARVVVETRRANRTRGLLGGLVVGGLLGATLGTVTCPRDDFFGCLMPMTRGMGFGGFVGGGAGLALSARRSGRQPPLVAYEGPPARYGIGATR